MRLLLYIVLAISTPHLAFAEFRHYERKVFYVSELPNVAFFVGEVHSDSGWALKRAIQSEPDTDTIVLISGGGSVYGGLIASQVVHDAGLNTIVPTAGYCASACSTIFFAGKNRWPNGKLGVHQMRSTDDKSATATVLSVEENTQSVLGDVITVLQDYDVPEFVLARMLSTPWHEMHYFGPTEKEVISERNLVTNPLKKSCIEDFAGWFVKAFEDQKWPENYPSCSNVKSVAAPEIGVRAKDIAGVNFEGKYEISECFGPSAQYLEGKEITVSSYRRSFLGYNFVISDPAVAELTFGSPRLLNDGSGNLATVPEQESLLISGAFQAIELSIAVVETDSSLKKMDIVIQENVTSCNLGFGEKK